MAPCPPRRGNRKGAVECGVKFMCGRWWRTMEATTPEAAQLSLDRFWATTGDARLRPPGRYAEPDELEDSERPRWPSVGELADTEVLMALPPAPYPATIEVHRSVDDRATVAFRGNRYSLNPGMGGTELSLRHRLGTSTLEIVSPSGHQLVSHRLAPAGAGMVVRTEEHRAALEKVVLGQFSTARPCDRKANRPPGVTALAERAKLLGDASEPSVDLDQMADIVRLAFPGATEVAREVAP
ncbi:MAG: Mu transposase domain-containing protein [Acidimicrobiales bacterium]